jgi:COMM domain containing 7
LYDALKTVSEKSSISEKELASVVKSLNVYLQNSIKNNTKIQQFYEELESLNFTEDKANFLTAVYKKYFAVLSRNLISQTLTINYLKDMDWRFGVTASNSEINEVGTTFLQIKLNFGDGKDNKYLELTLSQFYDFLHQMEKAKQTLDFFSN